MKRSRLGMPLTLTQDAWYIQGVCVEQVLWEFNKARSPKYPLTHLILCLDDEVLKAEFDRRDPAVWPIIEGKAKPLPQVDDFAYLGPISTILELDGAKNLLGSLGCPQSNRKWLEEVFCYLCVSFVAAVSFAEFRIGFYTSPDRYRPQHEGSYCCFWDAIMDSAFRRDGGLSIDRGEQESAYMQ